MLLPTSLLIAVLLLLLLRSNDAAAFSAPNHKRQAAVGKATATAAAPRITNRPTPTSESKPSSLSGGGGGRPIMVSVQQAMTTPTQKQGMTNLRFQASTQYETQPPPAPYHPCISEVLFQHRNHILAGTTSQNRVEELSNYHNNNNSRANNAEDLVPLYIQWQAEAKKNNVAAPLVGDPILRVTTTAIQFPGLTLKTVATVGCKQILLGTTTTTNDNNNNNDSDAAIAQLQITLISDELQAFGPPPLVWVFEHLTGISGGANNNNNKRRRTSSSSSSSERRTHSTNIITAKRTNNNNKDGNGGGGGVVFGSVAQLTIDISFPSLLLNMLPVSKVKAEKQGSEAIRSVVVRDIGPSLEALRTKYIAHVDRISTTK